MVNYLRPLLVVALSVLLLTACTSGTGVVSAQPALTPAPVTSTLDATPAPTAASAPTTGGGPLPSAGSVLTPRDIADLHLDLDPIPPGTPSGISQANAVSAALDALKALGGAGPALLVERGMGFISVDQPREPVWLVVVATRGNPHLGGPPCPETGPCDRPVMVDDIAGALVSDRTGGILRMFSRGHTASPAP